MAGRALRGEAHPGHALFRGLQGVEAAAADGCAEPADFADGLGDALEEVSVLVHQEAGAVLAAGLLVGGEDEDDVAWRPSAFAGALAQDGQHHRVHVLHVDGAAAPDAAVLYLAGEGVDLPVGCVGGDDVEVTVDEEGGSCGVGAFPAGDHAGAGGVGLEDGWLEARAGQDRGDMLGGGAFAGARVVTGVGGVDPDEVAAEGGDFILRGRRANRGGRGGCVVGHLVIVASAHVAGSAGGVEWVIAFAETGQVCYREAPRRGTTRAWPRPGGGIGRRASLRC